MKRLVAILFLFILLPVSVIGGAIWGVAHGLKIWYAEWSLPFHD